MKWRLPGADFRGDPASGSLALRARSPEVTHGAALVRASRLLGSVRIWPDERYGVGGNDSITTVCRVQAGNAALSLWERGWGVRAVIAAFWLQSASEEALIIGQEEKSTAF